MKRNPTVTPRTAQALGNERAQVTLGKLTQWYDNLFEFLQEEVPDWEAMVADEARNFNADESGFALYLTSNKVLAESGSKHVYQISNTAKTQITVMACFNARGDYPNPMIVFQGKRLRDVGQAGYPEALFGMSEKGWMEGSLFVEYLKSLHSFALDKGIKLPIILYDDMHSTHVSIEAAEFCQQHDIVLHSLLPHATHIMQPADIGLFSQMKVSVISGSGTLITLEKFSTRENFPGCLGKCGKKSQLSLLQYTLSDVLGYSHLTLTILMPQSWHLRMWQ